MTNIEQLIIIKYDEFLEFIARVASLAKYSGASGGWTTPPQETEEENSNSDGNEIEGPTVT